jgi:hypothetical protein
VLSIAPGLGLILPVTGSFRRPARTKSLTEVCGKCGHRLRTWPMMRLSTDHTTPRITYVECRCLLVGFQPDTHDLKKIVAAWSNLRRFQDRALNEFKRGEPEGNQGAKKLASIAVITAQKFGFEFVSFGHWLKVDSFFFEQVTERIDHIRSPVPGL